MKKIKLNNFIRLCSIFTIISIGIKKTANADTNIFIKPCFYIINPAALLITKLSFEFTLSGNKYIRTARWYPKETIIVNGNTGISQITIPYDKSVPKKNDFFCISQQAYFESNFDFSNASEQHTGVLNINLKFDEKTPNLNGNPIKTQFINITFNEPLIGNRHDIKITTLASFPYGIFPYSPYFQQFPCSGASSRVPNDSGITPEDMTETTAGNASTIDEAPSQCLTIPIDLSNLSL